MNITIEKPDNPIDALTDLSFMAHGRPGIIGNLTGLIRGELERSTAMEAEHRELFVSAFLLLEARQKGGATPEAWERIWNAVSALSKQYGIGSIEDVRALDAVIKQGAGA